LSKHGSPLIRRLEASDIPQAFGLSTAAGWNQTEQYWLRLIVLEPDGCFCVECDGVVAATTTVVCYGTELAWIGMVLTANEHRGRGFAKLLMNRALDFLASRKVSRIELDATEMGAHVYRKVGFVDACPIERWSRSGDAAPAAEAFDPGFDPAYDREVFGADRGDLLHKLGLIGSAAAPEAGFAMDRPGKNAAYFGPCVARSASSTRRLLTWFLSRHGAEETYWDLLPENSEAVRLAGEFGFSPVRRLTRMTFGKTAKYAGSDPSNIFAIAGFEYG